MLTFVYNVFVYGTISNCACINIVRVLICMCEFKSACVCMHRCHWW